MEYDLLVALMGPVSLGIVEWEMLAVENFGKFTNKTVCEKYFGELTQYTKKMVNHPNC